MMSSLRASNFRRIHVGLLLDLVLLFLMPAVIALFLVMVIRQLGSAGIDPETVSVVDLLTDPSLAVRSMYAVLTLQYCLSALCALLTVSGLGELESGSRNLLWAKRWFVLLMVADAVAMFAHMTDLMMPGDSIVTLTSILDFAALLLQLGFHALAVRALLRGYGEVLESIGAPAQSHRALALSRRFFSAVLLLVLLFAAAFLLTALRLVEQTRTVVLAAAAASLIFYVVCRVQVVCTARSVTGLIAALSE